MTDVVIIGGGVAGLSAGIYARLNGLDAGIYEMGRTAGGNLCGWERGGFTIDNCIHWLTGTNRATDTYKMWEELGALGDVEIIKNDTLYSYEYGGERLSLSRDPDKLRDDMLALSPADGREIRRFVRAVDTVRGLCGTAGAGFDRGLAHGAAFARLPSLARYYNMTAGDLARRFRHPLISRFLAGLLTERFGALGLLVVFAASRGRTAISRAAARPPWRGGWRNGSGR